MRSTSSIARTVPMTAVLDLADPTLSATGDEVRAAREQDWWARTDYGIAVLRYAEVRALLADRRLAQGSAKWPAWEPGPQVQAADARRPRTRVSHFPTSTEQENPCLRTGCLSAAS